MCKSFCTLCDRWSTFDDVDPSFGGDLSGGAVCPGCGVPWKRMEDVSETDELIGSTENSEKLIPKKLTPEQREKAFRKIVKEHQRGQVENTMVDSFTAQAVCAVLDLMAKKPELKAKLLSFSAKEIVRRVWILIQGE